ncbi:unnamed protein product, partial [Candidula unifasciata]
MATEVLATVVSEVAIYNVSTASSDVSYEARLIFQWICFAIVCELVDIFGTATNIINIICFIKQGFRDPVNVSLL